jgi:hypothetical protein
MHRLTTPVSNRAPIADDAAVTWIGGPPADEEAHVVWHALAAEHVRGYAALVERVGERLFRRDLETIGAAADIGFFRPFYLAHARQLVAALDGTLLRIGAPA